jgi:hypothetical protein
MLCLARIKLFVFMFPQRRSLPLARRGRGRLQNEQYFAHAFSPFVLPHITKTKPLTQCGALCIFGFKTLE